MPRIENPSLWIWPYQLSAEGKITKRDAAMIPDKVPSLSRHRRRAMRKMRRPEVACTAALMGTITDGSGPKTM
ncbi:MAG: hypothetical protein A4E60_00463 [Syntrophorhabdus sp. PtaB.Bin047]|nr:MAG: hypothetical protein A4E60_00463 [Syntrophorhabdus sp. PtaB.Bin047]